MCPGTGIARGTVGNRLDSKNARHGSTRRTTILDNALSREGLPFLQLGCVFVAWGFWYRNPSAGWSVAIALAPLALGLLVDQLPIRRTRADLPMGVFVLTAFLGVWAAYDRSGTQAVFLLFTPVGWQALWGLILAVLVFYALAGMRTETQYRWSLVLFSGLGAVAAIWFAAAQDWANKPAKFAAITRAGTAIQSLLPAASGEWFNSNIIAGVIAILWPLGLVLTLDIFLRDQDTLWFWGAWGLGTSTVMALGLVLTTSRGAWIGIGGSLLLGAIWWLAGRLGQRRNRLTVFATLIGVGMLGGGILLKLMPSYTLAIEDALSDRLGIFADSLLLLRDYPFTGFGLGEFAFLMEELSEVP